MAVGESGNPVAACLESFYSKSPRLSVRFSLYFYLSNWTIAVEQYDSSLYWASVRPYNFHFKLQIVFEQRQANILVFNLLAFLQAYDCGFFSVFEIGHEDTRIRAEIVVRAYQSHAQVIVSWRDPIYLVATFLIGKSPFAFGRNVLSVFGGNDVHL